jgi:hypothetical protein
LDGASRQRKTEGDREVRPATAGGLSPLRSLGMTRFFAGGESDGADADLH